MREVVLRAVAHDAALRGVFPVGRLLQRQVGDRREQGLLLGAGDEGLAVDEAVGQRRQAAEEIAAYAAFSRKVTNSSAAVG